jgi:hypothetical protein
MNEETQELLHRLELATSRSDVDRSTLDDETTLMRENWLAFSQLLRSAEDLPRPDAVALRCSVATKRRSWLWTLGCVASVVAALMIVWFCLPKPDSKLPQREVTNHVQSDGNVKQPSFSSAPPLGLNDMAWDDEDWDRSFTETAGAFERFHDAPRSHDLALSQLQNEFQELALEFETGSL